MHIIRKANANDVSLLADLIRSAFQDVAVRFELTPQNCPKHPSNYTDEWVENDFKRGVIYYILENNGKPAGCVALEKADTEICYLERLAVLHENRQKGFGRALVDQIFSDARAMGAKKISIGIISDDIELNGWYQKIGFIEGEKKTFPHLPFMVTFLSYDL